MFSMFPTVKSWIVFVMFAVSVIPYLVFYRYYISSGNYKSIIEKFDAKYANSSLPPILGILYSLTCVALLLLVGG